MTNNTNQVQPTTILDTFYADKAKKENERAERTQQLKNAGWGEWAAQFQQNANGAPQEKDTAYRQGSDPITDPAFQFNGLIPPNPLLDLSHATLTSESKNTDPSPFNPGRAERKDPEMKKNYIPEAINWDMSDMLGIAALIFDKAKQFAQTGVKQVSKGVTDTAKTLDISSLWSSSQHSKEKPAPNIILDTPEKHGKALLGVQYPNAEETKMRIMQNRQKIAKFQEQHHKIRATHEQAPITQEIHKAEQILMSDKEVSEKFTMSKMLQYAFAGVKRLYEKVKGHITESEAAWIVSEKRDVERRRVAQQSENINPPGKQTRKLGEGNLNIKSSRMDQAASRSAVGAG